VVSAGSAPSKRRVQQLLAGHPWGPDAGAIPPLCRGQPVCWRGGHGSSRRPATSITPGSTPSKAPGFPAAIFPRRARDLVRRRPRQAWPPCAAGTAHNLSSQARSPG